MGTKSHPVELAIAALAGRQHGVIAVWQLLGLGLGRDGIKYRVANGRLHRVHRGVYAVGHARLTLWGRFMAAVLACGSDALLSHRSAAALHNLKTGGSKIEVLSASRGRPGPSGINLHTTRDLPEQDRTVMDGIPVTSLARTLVDLAAVVDHRRLGRAVEEAERIKRLDVRAVEEVVARSHGRRGISDLKRLLAERRIPTDTREGLERDFADGLREAGLPMPAFNVLIEGFLVDAVWPQHRLIAEIDSYAFHDGTIRSFEEDRIRRNALTLRGWTLLHITSAQMEQASALVAEAISAARAA